MGQTGTPGSPFRSFRNRNYRLYAMGTMASAVGTWMQAVAQDWLILDLTRDSGSALGVTTALQFAPLLMFGLWGGVIADRHPKRRVLMISQAAMGAPALGLGVLTVTGAVRIWHIYAFALALGLAKAVDNPTRQSFVVELVRPAYRANAIALEGAAASAGRIVGPALAGVLIDLVGVGPVYLINALSSAAVIVGLLAMRDRELYAAPPASRAKGQVRAALAYVRGRRDLLLVFVLLGLVATFGMNPQITTALMIKKVFHASAGSLGVASTLFAVGALAGALLSAGSNRPSRRPMVGAVLAFGVLEAASALLPAYPLFLALLLPTGLMMVVFNTMTAMTIQLGVVPGMRGRIGGLYILIFTGTTPIGAPVIGWVGQVLGGRSALLAAGVVTILATACVAPLLARGAQPAPARSRGRAASRRSTDQVTPPP